jgi:N-acetylmuramoyl-L-alanine amidase
MTPQEETLLALCIWREARGEMVPTKTAVAWSIRNRVEQPRWWGTSYWSVILKPWQFSCFNENDPNATLWPTETDPSWLDSLAVANAVIVNPPLSPDPTGGAVSYFDVSLDNDPPSWATDGSMVKSFDSGRLHFYKLT